MPLRISAPVTGTMLAMSEVPDPVFAEEIVGPGAAIDPGDAATVAVLAPVDGTISSLKPHAFVVQTDTGQGVLVHLGIDTVDLDGAGFTLQAESGQSVRAGDALVSWDTTPARDRGKSLVVPVVVLEGEAADLQIGSGAVAAGDQLIEVG